MNPFSFTSAWIPAVLYILVLSGMLPPTYAEASVGKAVNFGVDGRVIPVWLGPRMKGLFGSVRYFEEGERA